jgi:hypothetical protein
MMTMLSALSMRRAISTTSASLAQNSGPERGDARNARVCLCGEDVHWHRQMRDAAARIGGGDGLVDNDRRLCWRGNGLGIKRDIAEQHVGICRLKIVDALEPLQHVA